MVGTDLQGSYQGCELATKVGGSLWLILNLELMKLASKGEMFLGKQEEKELEVEPKIKLGEQQDK